MAGARPVEPLASVAPYDAVAVGGGAYGGRRHANAYRFVRRHRRASAERPLRFFGGGSLDASASQRDIAPAPGVRRVLARLDNRGTGNLRRSPTPAPDPVGALPAHPVSRSTGGRGGRMDLRETVRPISAGST